MPFITNLGHYLDVEWEAFLIGRQQPQVSHKTLIEITKEACFFSFQPLSINVLMGAISAFIFQKKTSFNILARLEQRNDLFICIPRKTNSDKF